MEKARQIVDKDFVIAPIDNRIYGTFVEHLRNIIYGCMYNPGHPAADEQGFRKDVMQLLDELKTTFIRYPGGNFVSDYHWRDGVGPKEKRPIRFNRAWQEYETNKMGIDEFYDYCKKLGVDYMLAANLGTGTPEEAADEVEYCNIKEGTELSDMRRQNGHEQPHNIKMWCIGNEMDGPWQVCRQTPEEYGRKAVEAAKMMKWTDPSIELVVCGSCSPEPGMDTYPEWDRIVLDHTYDYVDYISLHRYFCYDPKIETTFHCPDTIEDVPYFPVDLAKFIDTVMAAARFIKGKKRSSKDIGVCFDEWGVVHSSDVCPEGENWKEKTEGRRVNSLLDAVIYGSVLITFLNKCDVVKLACQSIVIGSMIAVDPDGGAIRQSTFYPFAHAAAYGHGVTLRPAIECPKVKTRGYGEVPSIQAATVYNKETNEITVFAVNLNLRDDIAFSTDFRSFGEVELLEHIRLSDKEPLAGNNFENPDRIVPERVPIDHKSGEIVLPRLSWNVLRYGIK